MAITKEVKTLTESTYLAKGTVGDFDMPGARIMYFSLVVSSEQNKTAGLIEIKEATDKPTIKVNVVGTIRNTAYGEVTKIVNLSGEYLVSFMPPDIGNYLFQFTAYLDVDNMWNGTGGFTFGNEEVENVPVVSV